MPTRFRKSFKIFPGVKVNVSKGGISYTVGGKGYHLNFSKRGIRQTVGLPGSGLSNTSYIVKNEPKHDTESRDKESDRNSSANEKTETKVKDEQNQSQSVHRHRTSGWVLLLGVVVVYLGALVLGIIPPNFLSQLLHTLTDLTRTLGL